MIILNLAPLVERLTLALAILGIMAGALLAYALMNLLPRTKTAASKHAQPTSTLPSLGNILDATIFYSDQIYDWITEQCVTFGSRPWLRSITGCVPSLFISTPELYEDVFKTRFNSFQKEENGTHYFTDLFEKSMLTSDGDA